MRQITIHIDFPALDAFVAYLNSQDASQKMVDEIAADVDALTTRLQQSGTRLDDEVSAQQ